MKELKEGDSVKFVDQKGREGRALVTHLHGAYGINCGILKKDDGTEFDAGHPCINLVHVTHEDGKVDSWGKQLERESSVVHAASQHASGFY